MRATFEPAIRLYVNQPTPPLPEADDTFDLIFCGSVFSHLTDWAPWLLELRRVLKPAGVLLASLHGRGSWGKGLHSARGVPWDEDGTGMLVEYYDGSFENDWGPAVYVSEWWVREHWGRVLAIEGFEATGFAQPPNQMTGQAWLVARKPHDARSLTAAELESPSTDPRELTAALRGQRLAYEEIATRLRGQGDRT
jgi:SAM-dependent methyltransferase